MRPDGTLVKEADPMYKLIPHFLTKRYDAMNMITLDIPEAPVKRYINQKRKEDRSVSHLAVFIAAYLRTAAEFPYVNRFIMNRRVYQHNDFKVAMVVLRPGNDDDTMSKIALDYEDDIFTVQDKINEYITENRKDNNANSFDKWINALLAVPILPRMFINLLRFADRYGLMPKALIDASPFHASLLISNLASIRTNHIYHHVYEFGTTSVAITMGNMREVPKRVKGEITLERCIPLGVVMDERICSGHYFAQAFSRMKEYLADPSRLEGPRIVPED